MLDVRSLRVDYGQMRAVHDVSFSVGAGEVVSLLGANGAGKTTTLCAIAGLRRVCGGVVDFCGENITRWPADRIVRLGLCQVPEGRRLFGTLTVDENLRIGAYTMRASRRSLADSVDEIFSLFPVLRARRTQLAGTLSGGEQQMLAVGRALMSRPKLLALDEPSLGLSPLMTKVILETISRIAARGIGVLLVEQNARQALRTSKRGYVIENGRTVLSGEAQSLEADERIQALYLGGSA
jgi:branched-chain amino acid transport system ATP-binding protein